MLYIYIIYRGEASSPLKQNPFRSLYIQVSKKKNHTKNNLSAASRQRRASGLYQKRKYKN